MPLDYGQVQSLGPHPLPVGGFTKVGREAELSSEPVFSFQNPKARVSGVRAEGGNLKMDL